MQILIAEGDVPVAKFLSSNLEAEHYEVRIASRGRQVPQLLEEHESHLVILDSQLPDIDGIEVLRQIRAAKPHLPVLLLTENARVEDRVAGLDSGADDCLTKPFSFPELSARVRLYCGGATGRLSRSCALWICNWTACNGRSSAAAVRLP